jgi:putative methionine-R-sulfoxide reductase with GAF domain
LLFRDRRGAERPARARGGLARYVLLVLLPLTLLPLAVFASFAYVQARNNLRQQVSAQLETVATLKENQIDQWAAARTADLNNLAQSPDVLDATRLLLGGDRTAMDDAETSLVERLEEYLVKNPSYDTLFLVHGSDGAVLLTTSKHAEIAEINFFNAPYFNLARQSAQIAPPVFDPRIEEEAITILVGAPVIDPQQGAVAVLFAIIHDGQLSSIIASANPLLGSTGRSYAISSDGYEIGLTISDDTDKPTSAAIQQVLTEKTGDFARYRDPAGRDVFGNYRYLRSIDIALIVEQSAAEAFSPITEFTATLIAITVGTLLISLLVVFLFTRSLTRPIQELTDGAQRMAGGTLDVKVDLPRRDELGLLAEAFNSMAAQLGELYQRLEQRVAERTHQLATAAEVARTATATLKTAELLARAVELIRERFGYYQVSIFLLDETGREAVLREATGEVGARLKTSGFRLRVGPGSLIGWVAANQRPRIAMDVNKDATYLKEEQLPDTRSEAAIPLRAGTRVIGVLDVQSREPNAFQESDLQVLQTLADQIAVGVENGRLFSRQSQVVRLEQLLADLTARIHQTRQLDAILENTATELGRAFGARRVVVRLSPTPSAAARPAPNGHDDESGNGQGEAASPAPAAESDSAPPRRQRGLNLLDKL